MSDEVFQLRPISWGDVHISPTHHKDIHGRLRVNASLKYCSFIGVTLWMEGWDDHKPEQKAMILLELTRKANRIMTTLSLNYRKQLEAA